MDDQSIIALLVTVVIILMTLALIAWKFSANPANTILLVGLTDSGKTLMFSQLVTGHPLTTYTSMKENDFPGWKSAKGRIKYRLIDFPGADRLRKRLHTHWLGKQKSTIKGLIFIVDSATYGKYSKDAAEFLYDVLCDCPGKASVLVACNKQDQQEMAKSATGIRSSLEREFGLINQIRDQALPSIDGSESNNSQSLTNTGKQFVWSHLKRRIDFVECSAVAECDYDLSPVEDWINAL